MQGDFLGKFVGYYIGALDFVCEGWRLLRGVALRRVFLAARRLLRKQLVRKDDGGGATTGIAMYTFLVIARDIETAILEGAS